MCSVGEARELGAFLELWPPHLSGPEVPCLEHAGSCHLSMMVVVVVPSSFKKSSEVDGHCFDGVAGYRLCVFFLPAQSNKMETKAFGRGTLYPIQRCFRSQTPWKTRSLVRSSLTLATKEAEVPTSFIYNWKTQPRKAHT